MTEHQAEADLTLTDKGRIRVLENRVKDLEAMLERVRQFPADLDMSWTGLAVKQWIDTELGQTGNPAADNPWEGELPEDE